MIKEPKSASEAFVLKQESIKRRGNAIDIGMGVGNALTNATNLVICLINNDPSKTLDLKDIEDKIKEWTDKIYKTGQEKKDYESMPVVNDAEIIPIDEVGGQKEYNKRSEQEETINEERGVNIPF